MQFFAGEWECHICGKSRPDAQISVYSTDLESVSGVKFTQNVRYCNDDPDCTAEAPYKRFINIHPSAK